jgi:MATE family multidrug resistance protein
MWLAPILISIYMARATTLKPYLPALRYTPPDLTVIKDIIRLGLPIALTFFFEVAVFSIIGLFIASLGNTAMASHQIALNVWDVMYMPLMSIGAAMATRIGHAIGRGDRETVLLAVRCGTGLTIISGFVIMLLLLVNPGAVVHAYTDDVGIFAMAVVLVRLAALFIVLDAVQVAAASTLRAFKDTRFPFLAMAVAYWLVALPMGYWLGIVKAETPTQGTVGFWWAMIAGIIIAAILVVWRQRQLLRRPLPTADDYNPDSSHAGTG